jgi:hypothetical protein
VICKKSIGKVGKSMLKLKISWGNVLIGVSENMNRVDTHLLGESKNSWAVNELGMKVH